MEVTAALLLLTFTFVTIVIARWVWKRYSNHQFFKRHGIPGPDPDFIMGNILHLREGDHNDVITKWIKKYGNVFGFYMVDVPYMIINDIEVLKQILIKDFQFFSMRPTQFLDQPPIDKTLLVVDAHRWKEVRSVLSPTFSSGKIKLMSAIVDKKIDIAGEVIGKKAETEEPFNIHEVMQALTLDVIADCAFGMKTRCQDNPDDYFLNAARDFVRFSENPLLLLGMAFPFVFSLFKYLGRFLRAARMSRYTMKHLRFVIEHRKKNPAARSEDLLQLLINSSENDPSGKVKPLSDEEIASNAYSFLIAGYETTSTALAYTFHLLINNPEVQERLYQEMLEVDDASYKTVQSLPYLDQVFSECLRIYPPVPGFVARACSTDYEFGSLKVPKGANVIVPVWDIHHDPNLWPDPFHFDPDRFSPDNKSSINSMAYLPFGAGPRNCIGARFAQLEAKQTLFKLLKEYRFEKCEKSEDVISTKTISAFLTQPAHGVWLKAVPRN